MAVGDREEQRADTRDGDLLSGRPHAASRGNIQRVVSEFYNQYVTTINAFEANGEYPMNMPFEIRVNGLDKPNEVDGVSGAVGDNFDKARATLNSYDPNRIFSNTFLDVLFP
ncbi:MAG TPA: cholesterol oxidase substrate-binding domain-containing protein [Streptosporangiaceae bacterium]|nr:cholesterol oxidase substrate-binding domain-containing protein [Streptosporangiaceae bacterium]